jgi:hypothetical protein
MDCTNRVPLTEGLQTLINQKTITKLINDNYTVIVVYIILIVFLCLIMAYFIGHIRGVIKTYWKNNNRVDLAPPPTDNQYDKEADNEVYIKDTLTASYEMPSKYRLQSRENVYEHVPVGKQDFIKDVSSTYKEYNDLKSQYIKTDLKARNDDVIDTKILYKKYDDYTYKPKDEY